MNQLSRWPQLAALYRAAKTRPTVQMWLFGSALTSRSPADLDVLLVYHDLADIVVIRRMHSWWDTTPPIHIIAMTVQEESDYSFIRDTGARRII